MAADVACMRGKLALSGERAFRGRPGVIIRNSESLSIVVRPWTVVTDVEPVALIVGSEMKILASRQPDRSRRLPPSMALAAAALLALGWTLPGVPPTAVQSASRVVPAVTMQFGWGGGGGGAASASDRDFARRQDKLAARKAAAVPKGQVS